MKSGLEKAFKLIKKEEKRTGSDYVATVTYVNNGTAYVQIAGSDITDTPVVMSVDAKAGDTVRVRINNGKAWLTGNDTRPPNNSTEQVESVEKLTKAISKQVRAIPDEYLTKRMGAKIAIVYDQEVALQAKDNHITFGLPANFSRSLGVVVVRAWPLSTWTGAFVTVCNDGTVLAGEGYVDVYSGSAQRYQLTLALLYI